MSEQFKHIVLTAVVSAALAATAGYFAASRRAQTELDLQHRQHHAEIDKLTSLSESARAENESLRQQLQSAGVPVPAAPVVAARPADTGKIEAVRQLAAVQKQLASITEANRELQTRAVELQSSVDKLTSENRRMSAETEDLRESLDKTRRVVAATETELKSKTDRLVQAEANLARIREETAGATGQLRSVSGLLREFEELNRRRENTLTSLQRRYRELTDLYRSTLLTIEQQRDNPAVRQLPDASRIQSTVLAAEDDLRQINALNTQAQRLTQRLQTTR